MAIYGIGDLHLSLNGEKPMDIFPSWRGYLPRLEQAWRELVAPQDTVVLAGDTSWGAALSECRQDFAFLHTLPGRKVLLKGNHDYWWGTLAKMVRFLQQEGFDDFTFLHNNCIVADGVAVCGTRGWTLDSSDTQENQRMIQRECGRLRASLQAAPDMEKVVFFHYPPMCLSDQASELVAILKEYGVIRCYYGHLHGAAIRHAVQGVIDGIHYRLISADALSFCPLKI